MNYKLTLKSTAHNKKSNEDTHCLGIYTKFSKYSLIFKYPVITHTIHGPNAMTCKNQKKYCQALYILQCFQGFTTVIMYIILFLYIQNMNLVYEYYIIILTYRIIMNNYD